MVWFKRRDICRPIETFSEWFSYFSAKKKTGQCMGWASKQASKIGFIIIVIIVTIPWEDLSYTTSQHTHVRIAHAHQFFFPTIVWSKRGLDVGGKN